MSLSPRTVATLARVVREERAASYRLTRAGCEDLAARIRARLPAGWSVTCETIPSRRRAVITISPPADGSVDAVRHTLIVGDDD